MKFSLSNLISCWLVINNNVIKHLFSVHVHLGLEIKKNFGTFFYEKYFHFLQFDISCYSNQINLVQTQFMFNSNGNKQIKNMQKCIWKSKIKRDCIYRPVWQFETRKKKYFILANAYYANKFSIDFDLFIAGVQLCGHR